jgi:hypothetical protein
MLRLVVSVCPTPIWKYDLIAQMGVAEGNLTPLMPGAGLLLVLIGSRILLWIIAGTMGHLFPYRNRIEANEL